MFLIPRGSSLGLPTAAPFQRLSRVADDVLSGFPAVAAGAGKLVPATDIVEDDDAVTLRMELPGVGSEDLSLNLEKDTLTIRAEKSQEPAAKSGQIHRVERSFGVFERRFSVANTIDADGIEASLADGVLSVRLPKSERAKSRTIEVKSS
jgi:HSP20 family protein